MKNLLFAAAILACEICSAQQLPDYCVYLVKGDVTLKKGNAKPVPVKQNQFLYKNEILSIAKNSELTLINKDDKLLVLNTAANIKVSELEKKFNTELPSVTKSYAHLVYHELIDPNYDYTSFRQNNVGGVKGGVSRSDDCNNLIFPVEDLKTAEDTVRFKWHSSSRFNDYTFIIFDTSANEILTAAVKDTIHTVSVRDVLHGTPGKYYWVVKGKDAGCESDPMPFEIMKKEDEQKLIPALEIQKGNRDILSQLQIVDELEKDDWIYTAMKYYGTIVRDNPGNDPLTKSYVLFLLKYGFEEEATKAWSEMKKKM